MELVGELVAGPAGALPERIAALDHEPVDHAVEHDAVVEGAFCFLPGGGVGPLLRSFREANEVLDRAGGLLVKQADGESSLGGIEMGISAWLHGDSSHGRENRRAGSMIAVPDSRS